MKTKTKAKLYHYAELVHTGTGDVSALCYTKPRSINLKRQSWTIVPGLVTCRKCRERLKARRNWTSPANARE